MYLLRGSAGASPWGDECLQKQGLFEGRLARESLVGHEGDPDEVHPLLDQLEFAQTGDLAQDVDGGQRVHDPALGRDEEVGATKLRLIEAVADRIALAMANLKLQEAMRQQSVRDPLTGLFNRRYMEESLERELRRAARSNRTLGILMLDLDFFKHFNDNYGHDAGDAMLREFSALLGATFRGGDIACRYGGEEFALILPEASLEATSQRGEVLREKTKRLNVQHRGLSLGTVTLSVGVAAFPQHGSNSEALLRAADEALYAAKQSGRDRVVVAPLSK